MDTLTLKTDMLPDSLGDELFFQFCVGNRDVRIERTAKKDILIIPPSSSELGILNSELNMDMGLWNRKSKLGYVFDSSTGFTLPNGSVRSPDASWISKERWEVISDEDRKVFAPICPDFVIEIRSKTDVLKTLKEKMKECIENGAKLGWLLDMKNRQVFVYSPKLEGENSDELTVIKEVQGFDKKLEGREVLLDFELELSEF